MKTFLRFFFRLLYHQFAFTYDLVAAAVSFNRWKSWVVSVVPFVQGNEILEIGHGPGHLQHVLRAQSLRVVGIDESPQMGRLARRNLRRQSYLRTQDSTENPHRSDFTEISLTRGIAQRLPFQDQAFDTIVATFPTEYITDSATLAEIKRCLRDKGRLVVLPVALPKNQFLDWLFKVTHQRPLEALEIIQARLIEPFIKAGYKTDVETLDLPTGTLLIVLAKKP